nr:MAG TPA: major capsid protein [Caudoviricetes sp.]
MAFTQLDLNYATEYSKAMANAYPYWSYFSDLYGSPNSAVYKPLNGNAVAVQSMTVSGARATNRNNITGEFNRNFNTSEQVLTMRMDREWDTLVDPMDIREDPIVNIGNITKTFNEFQKVPEMDAYAASTLSNAASGFGSVDSTSLTADNILAQWDSYLAYMVNQRVPRDQIRAKMTPDTYKLLKEAAGITRFVEADTGIRNIDRNVGKLDGVVIAEVPAEMMMTAYDFTEGWQVEDGAKQINLLMFHPLAIAAPVVYETSMMSAPTAQSKGKWLYYERYYYDVFALNQRLPGIFANIASLPALSTITFTTIAGADSTHTIIQGLAPAPYGMAYVAKSGASADLPDYGEALTSGWTVVNNGDAVTTAASQVITIALVNVTKGNTAVAGGSATAVVGG